MVDMCYEKFIQIIDVKTGRGWAYGEEGWLSVSVTVVISARKGQAYLCIEYIFYKHTISHVHFNLAKHKKNVLSNGTTSKSQNKERYFHQQNLGELSSTWQGCAVP